MFLGHYAVALTAKRMAPSTSLGTFVFAAQFLDLLWPILLLFGIERVRIRPGLMEANSLEFIHYPISHSLLAAAGWAALIGGVYYFSRHYVVGALAIGGAVLSHWLLDAPMHRPDLPLWPGSDLLVGGGLWNSVPATLVIEVGLLALGVAFYVRTTKAADRIGHWGFWSMAAVLLFFFLGSAFGPPPSSERGLALGALGLWLFVPWGYWVDRHRTRRVPTP